MMIFMTLTSLALSQVFCENHLWVKHMSYTHICWYPFYHDGGEILYLYPSEALNLFT